MIVLALIAWFIFFFVAMILDLMMMTILGIHIMQVKEKIPKNVTIYLLYVLYTYLQRVAAL